MSSAALSAWSSSVSTAVLALSAVLLCVSGATAVEASERHLLNITERALLSVGSSGAHAGSSLAHGFIPQRNRFPYIAALITKSNHFRCGGTLIDKKLVLTAAHCVLSDSGRLLDPPTWAYIGLNNWQKDSPRQYERIRVKKIEWHPLYRRSSLTYDAAVLVLDQKAKAKPVALAPAKQRLWVGTSLLTAGFGATDRAPVSPQLMAALLPVQPTAVCSRVMLMPPTHFCLGGGALLRALCDGDSGGPLILQTLRKPDMQVGLFSFMPGNYKCGGRNNLGAATSVMAIRPWLDTMMKKHGK